MIWQVNSTTESVATSAIYSKDLLAFSIPSQLFPFFLDQLSPSPELPLCVDPWRREKKGIGQPTIANLQSAATATAKRPFLELPVITFEPRPAAV